MEKQKSKEIRKDTGGLNWPCLVLGIICMAFGLSVLDDPVVTKFDGVEIDVSSFRVPLAIISSFIGVYSLYLAIRNIR